MEESMEYGELDKPPLRDAPFADTATSVGSLAEPHDSSDSTNHIQGWRYLDPKSIGLCRLINLFTFSVLAIVAVVVGWVVSSNNPYPANLFVFAVWIILGMVGGIRVFWWPSWEYARWAYRVDDHVVQLRFGVVWHVSVSIPTSRLQHVDIHRGPLERGWGLASLEIHTAGTRHASHRIPGLDRSAAESLRDQLTEVANREPHGTSRE